MKKILLLAYDFPPYNSIGGQRPYSWYKHFYKFGIHPVVLTRHWDIPIRQAMDLILPSENQTLEITEEANRTVIRVPNRPDRRNQLVLKHGTKGKVILRKALSFYYEMLQFHLPSADTRYDLYQAARAYLKENKVEAVLVTCEPWILLKYGALLKKEFQIPFIADYRDGWTTNQAKTRRSLGARLKFAYFRKLERAYTAAADLITIASPTYADDLRREAGIEKPIRTIYNGYDQDHFYDLDQIGQSEDCFEMAYAGRTYGYQNWRMFLDGADEFIQRRGGSVRCRIVFYGMDFYPEMKAEILEYKPSLRPLIQTTERLPYAEVIRKLRKAHLLLLFSRAGTDWLSAKIFDYFAVGRKIMLAENDHGILENLILKHHGGTCCDSSAEVSSLLDDLYTEFEETGSVSHHTTGAEEFTRLNQAAEMVEVIRSCIEK